MDLADAYLDIVALQTSSLHVIVEFRRGRTTWATYVNAL
jgi:hypothetical protein